jgi:hypothetical protein
MEETRMHRVNLIRFGAVFGLLVALLASTVAVGSAQDGGSSLTIHNRLCPVEYSGDDVFGDCHGNPQDAGLEFAIDGPVSDAGATDGNGDITFGGLPAGTYNISGGVPGDFASTVVYCSVEDDPENMLEVTSTATGVSVDLPEATNVVCDWYNIPFDLKGDDGGTDDDGTDDGGTTTPPTTLPATGAGTAAGESNTGLMFGGLAVLALAGLAVVSRRRAFKL